MKQYPSISTNILSNVEVHVFDKIDGSNIRAEWNLKRGFYKFGSRKQLINEDHFLAKSIALINAQQEKLVEAARSLGITQGTFFFEFHGENSFAGQHDEADEHRCTLIDVDVYKKGFVSPADFVKAFGSVVETPALLHTGQITKELEDKIRNGTMPGMTFEGVVCKAPAFSRWGAPILFKIKSNLWIEKVKAYHKDPKVLAEIL